MQRVFADETSILERHLRQRGLNRSSRRDIVVSTFLSSNKHLSVDDLYGLVRRKAPGIGRTTVYRTLKLLESAGLAQALVLQGETRFERELNRRHHDHFICSVCGSIFEFSSDEIESLQEEEARKIGFRIEGHKHQVFGRCAKCQAASTKDASPRKET
jgi:Fur family ferric uptake transcriptional regulator